MEEGWRTRERVKEREKTVNNRFNSGGGTSLFLITHIPPVS